MSKHLFFVSLMVLTAMTFLQCNAIMQHILITE